jgi:hypothetical protein
MLEGLRKPADQIVIVVTLLAYGCPIQAIVHAFGLDEFPQNRLLVEQWERDRKAASLAKRTLHLDSPAVLLDNAQGNREAKSHPWLDGSVWGSVKALKKPGQIVLGNADACIGNGDDHFLLFPLSYDCDPATIGRIFVRVFQENQKDLLEIIGVARDDSVLECL